MGVIKATVWVLLKQLYGCSSSNCMGVIKATVWVLLKVWVYQSNCMGVIKATVWVLLKQLYGCY